jgi:hypothetical protein
MVRTFKTGAGRRTADFPVNGCQFKDLDFWIFPADCFMKIISISFGPFFNFFYFEAFFRRPVVAAGGSL